ncbi:calcium activated cation channel [Clavulina sp. PMI_390]|nr:calcium activated cation channel [Clavulina sp. PMI_390]
MADAIGDEAPLLNGSGGARPQPETIDRIVKRLRALTLKLLPLEVDPELIAEPNSRITTPAVVKAYSKAAGDFEDALPYCLLRARQTFMYDANHNPADFGENIARATACEVIARRIIHSSEPSRLNDIMSSRFRHLDRDGDPSAISSALELAVDQHCTIFLSSTESQSVVNSLWRGDWVQRNNANEDIDYIPYGELKKRGEVSYFDPSRIAVPRYQNWLRMVIWLFFLFVYSQSVQQPVELQKDPHFDAWEVILYGMGLAYTIEDLYKLYKIFRFFTWRSLGFWNFIGLLTDGLLTWAFTLRLIGLLQHDEHMQKMYKLHSFQILSTVSPLIWMKLITVLDGFKYIGTLQICVSRMMQESAIFFCLLAILGIGFAQAMYALDASDGQTEHGPIVINQLVQALLQSPDFESASESPVGLILYYFWSASVTVILLNVLVSLFSSAYSDVTDDAAAEFLTFFAEKTVGMIRAPDDYVFPAPFNLVEAVIVVPLGMFMSPKLYAQWSRAVMIVLFFPALAFIHVFESYIDTPHNRYMRQFFPESDDGSEDDPSVQNPVPGEEEEGGREISRVKFAEIVRAFPDPMSSMEGNILKQIQLLHEKLDAIKGGELNRAKKEED